MSKYSNYSFNHIYSNSLKAKPSADECRFFIDYQEAVYAYKSAKICKFESVLPSEEAYKEAVLTHMADNESNAIEEYEIGVAIFDIKSNSLIRKYPAENFAYSGNVYSILIDGFDYESWSYAFYCNDVFFTDKRADRYINVAEYGHFSESEVLMAVFDSDFVYDDKRPEIKYEDAFVYQLHVRGLTVHSSSGTKYKGTFKGVADKLDYLYKLGVTTLEFQPVNEFNECDPKTGRLNYWGYCDGYYYAPKASYAYSNNPSLEFLSLVKDIHNHNQEIILQMYFSSEFDKCEIVQILEYWTVKYHIDGFHLLSANAPIDLIDKSSVLSKTKILCDRLDGASLNNAIGNKTSRRYALYRDDYMYTMRRFLKADEFSLNDAVSKIRENNSGFATINYFDAFNSFTLLDMVSYERKHNEDNGEENRDGSDYNCSWNCGEEGPTRKQKILSLRKKQIKNAMMLLAVSAGTPMIYMGDEFGRSQMGNNNPYCLDSKITWVDWSLTKKQFNQSEFITKLIELRKEFICLHNNRELSMVDVSGCGYPEISYHGDSAWKSQTEGHRHNLGIMYCDNGKLLYLAINMHWDTTTLAFPRAPKGYEWRAFLSTNDDIKLEDINPNEDLNVNVPEHSIVLYEIVKRTGDK